MKDFKQVDGKIRFEFQGAQLAAVCVWKLTGGFGITSNYRVVLDWAPRVADPM